ncbi:UDP-2,4-diacetamido-2,4,6-trideoxy-beta-L-altropyranose hydrolase [Alphaproteobacteria bacterium]|nr:UDP-2,4-diacetamido-2,4,6-trideoxy-beta-L-altropyranose hydrolase [Alphaproteobacteria bacterium]
MEYDIIFRVDAHPDVALGHLKRCISLSIQLQKLGYNSVFVCFDDKSSIDLLEFSDQSYVAIPYKVNQNESRHLEIEILFDLHSRNSVIILDSYDCTDIYFDALRQKFSIIVYIDDLGFDFPVDLVINPLFMENVNYLNSKNQLLGLSYMILSQEYANTPDNKDIQSPKSLVVTMGGIDHYNLSVRAIKMLEEINQDIVIDVVVGPFYENLNLIVEAKAKSKSTINIHQNLQGLYSLFSRASFGLSAGGNTIFELVATATPSVGIALWKNQESNIKFLGERGAILPLTYDSTHIDRALLENLRYLVSDDNMYGYLAAAGRKLVDGKGASRIALHIKSIIEKP